MVILGIALITWIIETVIPWITDVLLPGIFQVILYIVGGALALAAGIGVLYLLYKFSLWLDWMIYRKDARAKKTTLTLEQRRYTLLQHAGAYGIHTISATNLQDFERKVKFRGAHLSGLAETGHHKSFRNQHDVSSKEQIILSEAKSYFDILAYLNTLKKSSKIVPRLENYYQQ